MRICRGVPILFTLITLPEAGVEIHLQRLLYFKETIAIAENHKGIN